MADGQGTRRPLHRLAGAVLAGYIRFVQATSRWTAEIDAIFRAYYHLHPAIIAFWHGRFLPLLIIRTPAIPVQAMPARHRDAELMGEALHHFGIGLIRGVGERHCNHSGSHALLSAELRDGLDGHDSRRATRPGASREPWHCYHRSPVATADPSRSNCNLTLPYTGDVKPYDDQLTILDPRLCCR
jgi:hypothetical protein